MEKLNTITCDASVFTVTDNTTLGELLTILNLGDKPHETPTPKMLRETAGAPIATEERCTIYRSLQNLRLYPLSAALVRALIGVQ